MVENVFKLGELFRNKLNEYIEISSIVKLVRGKGLLNVIVINDNEESDIVWNICFCLRDYGLLVKLIYGNIIWFVLLFVMNEE